MHLDFSGVNFHLICIFVHRYLTTCRECPNKYPWIGDSEGTGIAGRDNYTPEN